MFVDYCRAKEGWVLEFIEALVAIESPSDDPIAVNRCGVELAARLEAIGGAVTRIAATSAGDHVRASFGRGDRQILMLGHFDTVWPVGTLPRMPIKREGGRLHGPGIFDMKAGIGLAALATRAVIDEIAGTRIVSGALGCAKRCPQRQSADAAHAIDAYPHARSSLICQRNYPQCRKAM